NTISILRSSGHQVLDDAAIRIVKLAAPFAVFPQNIRKEVDILHIIRTWKFMRDNRLTSR
ncbi:MAG TPA: energy transducer TonB, partial [Gammaproteobacteria bacterium]|nr:energy transducer TonB [Gammaproteobacteria bacterium]